MLGDFRQTPVLHFLPFPGILEPHTSKTNALELSYTQALLTFFKNLLKC